MLRGSYRYNVRSNEPLSNDTIARYAPSVFAEKAASDTSSKYSFIPTVVVVDALKTQGWMPFQAMQSRSRSEDGKIAAKHLLRFRNVSQDLKVGDGIAELILTNSHDGTSAFKLMGGVYRLVCSNGMIVGDTVASESVRHIGFTQDKVIEASYKILESVPKIAGQVDTFQSIELSRDERLALAESALQVRYNTEENERAPIRADQLLLTRRHEDRAASLWNTFNVIQENIIRGGLRGISSTTQPGQRARRVRTREVGSVTENVRLNRALWTLAERMAELKQA